jgi:hypothetical protein
VHVTGEVSDRGNGMYGARYCATVAGRYQLRILSGARCRALSHAISRCESLAFLPFVFGALICHSLLSTHVVARHMRKSVMQ